MYNWRKMSPEMRQEVLEHRRKLGVSWHGPAHPLLDAKVYHVSATNYEHRRIVGHTPTRMSRFEADLMDVLASHTRSILAWCVLPNHYHVLVDTEHFQALVSALGRLHGRTAFAWNGEENRRGRQCWHRCSDRAIRGERHQWATLNYVLHNPVHHGYVKKWQDWPFSNAAAYLAEVGVDVAQQRWRDYPILDFGRKWDAAES